MQKLSTMHDHLIRQSSIFVSWPILSEYWLHHQFLFPEFLNGFLLSTHTNRPFKINSIKIQPLLCLDYANSKEIESDLRELSLKMHQQANFTPIFKVMAFTLDFFLRSNFFFRFHLFFYQKFYLTSIKLKMFKFRHFFQI